MDKSTDMEASKTVENKTADKVEKAPENPIDKIPGDTKK
jgi:hypothetical protein